MCGKNVAAACGESCQRGLCLPGGERSERLIDRGLPSLTGDEAVRILSRNDANVMLGQRHIDERAAP